MIGYYSDEEVQALGFGACGKNVKISKTSTIYNRANVFLGSNIRIDNFCTLAISGSSKLHIGDHVQISAYCFINGLANVTLEDFVSLAPYSRIFSSSDDYTGAGLTNATIPPEFLRTVSGDVLVKRHTILGAGTTVTPGVTLAEGTSVGAHSFVWTDSEPWSIIRGNPAKYFMDRSRDLLELEKQLLEQEKQSE